MTRHALLLSLVRHELRLVEDRVLPRAFDSRASLILDRLEVVEARLLDELAGEALGVAA